MILAQIKIIVPGAIILLFFIVFTICVIVKNRKDDEIENCIENSKTYLVNDFFEFRKRMLVNFDVKALDLKGVYVIYNRTKDMNYVGQSTNVVDRINMHFTGKGNGDVYADYKNGDVFIIRYVLLNSTKYKDLNKLEKDLITAYNAKEKGYNKTKGNK